MTEFRCNFHNHTVLSPCADLTMTTENYINFLTKSSLDWISITDHNSSANVRNYKKIIEENSGIKVIPGIEVQSI
ncbi:MAG TPA: PHP domain-containing protein, partial [Tepiditoga sp.]|nr:PHP domain-containing protein [Tepiditoga sp.]